MTPRIHLPGENNIDVIPRIHLPGENNTDTTHCIHLLGDNNTDVTLCIHLPGENNTDATLRIHLPGENNIDMTCRIHLPGENITDMTPHVHLRRTKDIDLGHTHTHLQGNYRSLLLLTEEKHHKIEDRQLQSMSDLSYCLKLSYKNPLTSMVTIIKSAVEPPLSNPLLIL